MYRQETDFFENSLRVSSVKDIFTLEKLDSDLFRSQHHCQQQRKTLFGGQVLGQSLMAAYKTLDKVLPHSLHAYFLRTGSDESPIIFDVENVRDGGSFVSRRSVARQFGRPIFNMSCSFHIQENGYQHQESFPSGVPSTEELLKNRRKPKWARDDISHTGSIPPFQILPVDGSILSKQVSEPWSCMWIKATETLPKDPIYHYCSLAMASDIGLLATALLPHEATVFDKNIVAGSVDHAMWFHSSDFKADEWLLYKTVSPWAGGARGFSNGSIYTREGQLIASTAQEGLIRPINLEPP
ncbi:MAG: acyl-CoA thioesterase-2 [Lentisphaeria bacterium]|jgi:acyl-CoA thioesterase-2